MQVFVLRTDLSLTNPPVVASYPELPILDRNYHGSDIALLSLPQQAISLDPDRRQVLLISTWRTDFSAQVVNDEAQRRINESFTQFMQLNALAQVQNATNLFGWNTSTWEPVYLNTYTIAKTGWTYVNAVRQTSDSLAINLPVDPTDDGNWPPRIAPIYIPTI
jgi:hypothetical protein